MAWIKVAGSCSTGPCPTVYTNPVTGAVRLQGDTVSPHLSIPATEGMLEFAASDWQSLVEQYLAQSTR
jgi:hypothetical protein